MRIAIYKDDLSTGRGADKAVAFLANGLAARGHEVYLLTLQTESSSFSCALTPAVRVVRLAATGTAWLRIAETGADVVVSTGTNELRDLASDHARGPFPRPVLMQFHTDPAYPFKWRHPLRNRATRRALRRCDFVQVLLPCHLDAARRQLGHGAPTRLVVIGNPSSPRANDISSAADHAEILCPAALNDDKNQYLLLRAFARLADDFPAWRVRLCGGGTQAYTDLLTGFVRRHGLSGRVIFEGYRDLAEPYTSCAFVAFPSKSEGFSLAVAEAAAYGRPTVALRTTPALRDLVRHGETGLLSAPSPRAFADALRVLMADAALRERLGRNAADLFATDYSPNRILDLWEHTLDDLRRLRQ